MIEPLEHIITRALEINEELAGRDLRINEEHRRQRLSRVIHGDLSTSNTNECFTEYSGSISIDGFQHPSDPQKSSALVQLPTELRLKILRSLLVQSHPITTWKDYFDDYADTEEGAKKSQWLSLSSQILQCCQLLYQNGVAMLYQENTITIQTFRWHVHPPYDTCYFSVLDEITGFPGWPMLASQVSLESMPEDLSNLRQSDNPIISDIDNLEKLSSTTCKILLRFDNIHIIQDLDSFSSSMRISSDIVTFGLTYLLRNYLAGRNVTVSLWHEWYTPKWVRVLKCYEQWRCKSITFLNWENRDSIMTDPDTLSTQQIITSSTPVKNIETMVDFYNKLLRLGKYFNSTGVHGFFSGWFYEWTQIQHALIEQDEQRFRKWTRDLLVKMLLSVAADEEAVILELVEMLDDEEMWNEGQQRIDICGVNEELIQNGLRLDAESPKV